jgi:hypothetical protein
MTALTAAVSDLFIGWLNREFDRHYTSEGGDGAPIARDAGRSLQVSVSPLYDVDADSGWTRRCDAVARQFQELSSNAITLWLPPDADLPHGDRTDFLHRVADAAAVLQPGERGQVEFPVTLTLRKTGSEASYVHVTGGLAPHWARLTGKAYGQYVLDTTPIHRLPEPETRVADLIEWVALLGNGMKAGASSELKAEDAWTVTRPNEWAGHTIIGAAPGSDPTNGTGVRKLLRDALRSEARQTAPEGAARALVLVAICRTIDEENATIALRGCDPSMFEAFDLICLVADGRCKSLFGPRPERL